MKSDLVYLTYNNNTLVITSDENETLLTLELHPNQVSEIAHLLSSNLPFKAEAILKPKSQSTLYMSRTD